MSRKAEVYARIIKTGMPSFCRQSLASVATVLLNVNAAVYGDAAVAAMSVVGRIFMFVFSFMLGFGQGFQPLRATISVQSGTTGCAGPLISQCWWARC